VVKFPDKYEWQKGFNPENKWGLVNTNKGTLLECINGASERDIASAFGSTSQYARLNEIHAHVIQNKEKEYTCRKI